MNQPLVTDADLRAQRDVLPVAVIADSIDDELLGDELRDPRAQFRLHQVQHQVQGRDAAGAGEAVAVDGEELVAEQNAGEFLSQCRRFSQWIVARYFSSSPALASA